MDELRRAGVVKAIGIGVNETQVCLDALDIGDLGPLARPTLPVQLARLLRQA